MMDLLHFVNIITTQSLTGLIIWLLNNSNFFDNIGKCLKKMLAHYLPFATRTKKLVMEGHVTYTRSSMFCHMTNELKGVLHHLNENIDNVGFVNNVEAIGIGNNDDSVHIKALNVPIQRRNVHVGNGLYVSITKYKEEAKNDYGTTLNVYIVLTMSSDTMAYSQMHAFLRECATRYKQHVHNKSGSQMIFEYRCNDDNEKPVFDSMPFTSNKTFDTMFFDGKDALVKRIIDFESAEGRQRSERLGMQHAIGFLFHGVPGCGKTSTIKAIANLTRRHIVVIRMDRILRQNPEGCVDVLKTIMQSDSIGDLEIKQKDRLWVFEETDCWQNIIKPRALMHQDPSKRKDEAKVKDGATKDSASMLIDVLQQVSTSSSQKHHEVSQLGGLLELLDGLMEMPDRMIIMTTNHPESMDAALIRPGRIDICHEFKRLGRQHVCDVYKLWYNEPVPSDLAHLVLDHHFTQAELAQLFVANDAQHAAKAIIATFD